MPQQYLSTDPNAGIPVDGHLSTDPNAGEPRVESLQGLSATGSFLGSHRPIAESGDPLGAVDRLLERYVNPALQNAAHPTSLTDMVNLLIPGQVGPLAGELLGKGAALLGRGAVRGAAAVGDMVSPDLVGVVSPRLGRGIELAQRLRARMAPQASPQAASPPQKPPRAGSLEEFMSASPERRAEIKAARADYFGRGNKPEPTASVAPPAAPSGAPPASATPASARSTRTPPASDRVKLTPQEREAFEAYVDQGYDPADVMQAILKERQAAAPSAAPKATNAPGLSDIERTEYQRLLGRGVDPDQAMAMVEQQRALVKRTGLPTAEEARRRVLDRNETGRWRD